MEGMLKVSELLFSKIYVEILNYRDYYILKEEQYKVCSYNSWNEHYFALFENSKLQLLLISIGLNKKIRKAI